MADMSQFRVDRLADPTDRKKMLTSIVEQLRNEKPELSLRKHLADLLEDNHPEVKATFERVEAGRPPEGVKDKHRRAYELHSEGFSRAEGAEQLKKEGGREISVSTFANWAKKGDPNSAPTERFDLEGMKTNLLETLRSGEPELSSQRLLADLLDGAHPKAKINLRTRGAGAPNMHIKDEHLLAYDLKAETKEAGAQLMFEKDHNISATTFDEWREIGKSVREHDFSDPDQ